MAQTPEAKIKQYVREQVTQAFGVHSWRVSPVSRGLGSRGVPDYLFCIHGKFVAIECKADLSKKPTALQVIQLDQIIAAGGLALVVAERNPKFIERIREHIGLVENEIR